MLQAQPLYLTLSQAKMFLSVRCSTVQEESLVCEPFKHQVMSEGRKKHLIDASSNLEVVGSCDKEGIEPEDKAFNYQLQPSSLLMSFW